MRCKWEDFFDPVTLIRGQIFEEENRINRVHITENQIDGRIKGTKKTRALIDLQDGDIQEEHMHCNCLTAAEGKHCEHLAATLFYVKHRTSFFRNQLFEEIYRQEKEQENITEIIGNIENERLVAFLLKEFSEDEALLSRFKGYFEIPVSVNNIGYYHKCIDSIMSKYEDRIKTKCVLNTIIKEEVVDEVTDFMHDELRSLIRRREFTLSCQMLHKIMEMFSFNETGDVMGTSDSLMEYWQECWRIIYEESDAEVRELQFRWLLWYLSEVGAANPLSSYVEEMLMDYFHESDYLERKVKGIDFAVEKSNYYTEKWMRDYCCTHLLKLKLQLLIEMNADMSDIEETFRLAASDGKTSLIYANYLLENDKAVEAVEVLVSSLDLINLEHRNRLEIEELLQEIYDNVDEIDIQRMVLMKIFKSATDFDLNLYKEMKKLYSSEEWGSQRRKIIGLLGVDEQNYIYEYEGEYELLMKNIIKSSNIQMLQRYEELLRHHYPDKILKFYKRHVEMMVRHKSSRPAYEEILEYLIHMQEYPGGNDEVYRIVRRLRTRYKNKSTMIDVLDYFR